MKDVYPKVLPGKCEAIDFHKPHHNPLSPAISGKYRLKSLYDRLKEKADQHKEERLSKQPVSGLHPQIHSKSFLITGGAGFIGCNLAHRIMETGHRVTIYDNLSGPGSETNLRWLKEQHGDQIEIRIDDVRNSYGIAEAVRGANVIYHFASQVTLNGSFADPEADFDVNVRGTLNILNALGKISEPPPLIYASTNKVYGQLPHIALLIGDKTYQPVDPMIRKYGLGEHMPLDHCSPYGCSKGAADQYVTGYAQELERPAVVLRTSCVYGPHQEGNKDQGWVSHFLASGVQQQKLTIYGDGKQVRDILYIDDFVDACILAYDHIDALSGKAYNIGAGPNNTVSVLQVVKMIENLIGKSIRIEFEKFRTRDPHYYVSDIRKFREVTGWNPTLSPEEGIIQAYHWMERKINVGSMESEAA